MPTTHPAAPDQSVASPRLPEPIRILLAPVILLAAIFVPYLLTLAPPVQQAVAGMPEVGQLAVALVLLAGTTLVAVGLLALVARYVDRVRLRDYGWRWDARSLPALLLGIGVSLACVIPALAVLAAMGLLGAPEDRGDAALWIVVTMALGQAFLLQGIPEELIFRGYLLTTLRDRGPVAAVWISAVLFGALHLVSQGGQQGVLGHLAYLAWPFGFGLAAGALCLATRSVWAAVGIHGGSHVATLITDLLGWGSGPVAWVTIGVIYTLVGVLVLRRYQARRPA